MQLVRAKKRVQPLFGVLDARHSRITTPAKQSPGTANRSSFRSLLDRGVWKSAPSWNA
jgi:hypothetical protein